MSFDNSDTSDDEMPPLEESSPTKIMGLSSSTFTTTNNSNNHNTRRIVRAMRPPTSASSTTNMTDASTAILLTNLFPPDGHKNNNGNVDNNNNNTSGGGGGGGDNSNNTEDEEDHPKKECKSNSNIKTNNSNHNHHNNPFSALQNEISESDEDDDEQEEDDNEDEDDDREEEEDNNDDDWEEDEENNSSHYYDDDDDEDEDEDDDPVDFYDDDDDDDDDDMDHHGMPRRIPPGMLNFLHMMSMMERDNMNSNDDDDDSDHGPCNCPNCAMERLGCKAEEESDTDDNLELDEHTILDPTASPCVICMEPETATRSFARLPCCCGVSKAIESTSSMRFCYKCLVRYLAKNGSPVPNNNSPGNNDNIINNNVNVNINDHDGSGGTGRSDGSILAGECPRCKHLFVLEEIPDEYEWNIHSQKWEKDEETNNVPYYKKTKAQIASTKSMFWYIGQKNSGDYRPYLMTLGFMKPHYIPEELLLNDSGSKGKIQQLCQWGLLQKYKATTITTTMKWGLPFMVKNKLQQLFWSKLIPSYILDASQNSPNCEGLVYYIDPIVQMELRSLLSKHLITPSISDSGSESGSDFHLCPSGISSDEKRDENERNQTILIVLNCGASAWMALGQFRLVRMVRLINHAISLLLLSSKYLLPPIDKWNINVNVNRFGYCKEFMIISSTTCHYNLIWHVITGLNITLVLLALRIFVQIFWIGFYVTTGFLACNFVGSCFIQPKSLFRRLSRNGLIFYIIYRLIFASCCAFTGRNNMMAQTDDTMTIQKEEL